MKEVKLTFIILLFVTLSDCKDCGDPPEVLGAYYKNLNKSIVQYECHSTNKDHYELNGNPEIKCLSNGSWTLNNFTCQNVLKGLHPWYNSPTDKPSTDQKNYKTIIIITSILVIILIIAIVVLVSVRYFAKRKQKTNVNGSKHQVDAEVPESLEILSKDNKDVCGRKFPIGIVKDWSDITIHKEVGKGSFGKVYQAYLHLNEVQRIEVAVKEAFEKDAKEEMLDEAKTMIRVSKHDHIVNFQGVCVHNDLVYLLLEFCSLGRIDNFLQKYAKQMESKLANQDFTDLVQWGADIADGMEFLVSENIIHGDLAARNVLLTHERKAKIADFGLSTRIYIQTSEQKAARNGTFPFRWAAYEVIQSGATIKESSDVWSFGVLIWELFHLGSVIPYGDKTNFGEVKDFLKNGQRLSKPEFCPEQIYELMQECWQEKHWARPTFSKLKSLFKEFETIEISNEKGDKIIQQSTRRKDGNINLKQPEVNENGYLKVTKSSEVQNEEISDGFELELSQTSQAELEIKNEEIRDRLELELSNTSQAELEISQAFLSRNQVFQNLTYFQAEINN